jgi:hypothetical protein
MTRNIGGDRQRLHDAFADTAREDFVGAAMAAARPRPGRTWSDDARPVLKT